MRKFVDSDCNPDLVRALTVAVIGYGNQGRAQALNLRDQGIEVVVGSRQGRSFDSAMQDGFHSTGITEAVSNADLALMVVPDEYMKDVYINEVQPGLNEGCHLVFSHGFAFTYGQIVPKYGALLVSPVGPGTAVREKFVAGSGIPGFVAAEPESLLPLALSFAWGIGCSRVGLFETTFREETECDLFGEQVVLCGGMPELAVAAFETLVEAGYSPEIAYNECVQQVALLANLIANEGIAGMKKLISDTAEWGSYRAASKIVNRQTREAMKEILNDINSGSFAESWLEESERGKIELQKLRSEQANRFVEAVFRSKG